jgi:nitrite reductase/ring-hydroxylating ferredoxin subunit
VNPAATGESVRVLREHELPPGGRRVVHALESTVALVNVGGRIFAFAERCPHAGGPLVHGRVSGAPLPTEREEYVWGREGRVLTCPWHGWQFDLESGRALFDSRVAVATYQVHVRDGWIEVSRR